MTDQSLREALEQLAAKYQHEADGGGGTESFRCTADKLNALLAAHPAEPAPFDPETYEDGGTEEAQGVISSEEAAQDPWGWGRDAQRRYEEAVAQGMPRLPGDDQPKPLPVVSVDRVAEAIEATGFVDPDDGTLPRWDGQATPVWTSPRALAEALRDAGVFQEPTQPLLDREAARAVLRSHYTQMGPGIVSGKPFQARCACGVQYDRELDHLADMLVELARPLPTREQIEEIIATKVMRYDSAADVRLVDDGDVEALDAGTAAVLALLTGKADQ